MTDRVSLVMTGRGGQGGKLAMELLAWSASAQGLIPVLYSVYGALIRGGDISSSLVVADVDPGVAICDSFDVMCALHNNWFDRYYALLRPESVLIADKEQLDSEWFVRQDVRHVTVSFGELAGESGDRRASRDERGPSSRRRGPPGRRRDRPIAKRRRAKRASARSELRARGRCEQRAGGRNASRE